MVNHILEFKNIIYSNKTFLITEENNIDDINLYHDNYKIIDNII